MLRSLTNVLHPARFQGRGRRRNYFEGWYLKVVDPTRDLAFAAIPGLSYDAAGRGHAFVQVVDGVRERGEYHRFDLRELAVGRTPRATPTPDAFDFAVGANRFSESGMDLDVPGCRAVLGFRQNTPWPRRPWSPGAMGPFSFAPAMQCKHGVMSLHHDVTGTIQLGDRPPVTLSDAATGYIEKDWGSAFPLRWTWLQTNHLAGETAPACLMVSAGVVPWVTGAFEGHIAALLWRGRLEVFATYNASRMRRDIRGGEVHLRFRRPSLRYRDTWLEVVAPLPTGGITLAAPLEAGGMGGHVNESLTAETRVRFGHGRQVLLDTSTAYTGFELGGVGH